MRTLGLFIVLALAIASATGSADPATPASSGMIAVPNLIGKTAVEARVLVKKAGFSSTLEVDTAPLDCDGPKQDGKIRCQDPEPGKLARGYTTIHVAVYHAPTHPGRILREQLATLVGMTVDQAKAALKKMGHVGEVHVTTLVRMAPKCGLDKVCAVEPESGIDVHGDVTLDINPKLKITAPPP